VKTLIKNIQHTQMRITELANPLTEGLDTSTPIEFIRRLAACDTGLFTGYAGYPNVYDESIENDSVKTIQAMVQALIHPEGKIIFGGCGTSGRLAHLLAYELNNYWKDKAVLSKISTSSSAVPLEASSSSSSSSTSSLRSLKFHYLLAGGDKEI
jgi:N-acetylmuramic acid 6-phosphate (MurNAc-6-P) etherase